MCTSRYFVMGIRIYNKQDCETLDQQRSYVCSSPSSSLTKCCGFVKHHAVPTNIEQCKFQNPLTNFLLFSWVLTQFPTDVLCLIRFTTLLQVTTLILRCALTPHFSKESLAEHHAHKQQTTRSDTLNAPDMLTTLRKESQD